MNNTTRESHKKTDNVFYNIPTGLNNTAWESPNKPDNTLPNIPTGLNNTAQGCGTPLPWGNHIRPSISTPKGLRHISTNASWANQRNSVGVEKRAGKASLTQGSGVPQPWAVIWNPVGILNTYVGISILHPERKNVGNDKNGILERAILEKIKTTQGRIQYES